MDNAPSSPPPKESVIGARCLLPSQNTCRHLLQTSLGGGGLSMLNVFFGRGFQVQSHISIDKQKTRAKVPLNQSIKVLKQWPWNEIYFRMESCDFCLDNISLDNFISINKHIKSQVQRHIQFLQCLFKVFGACCLPRIHAKT
jgi:hypothetical protein